MNFDPVTVGLLVRAVKFSHAGDTYRLAICLTGSIASRIGDEEAFVLGGLLGEPLAVGLGAGPLPAWMSQTIGEEQWPSEYFREMSFEERFGA